MDILSIFPKAIIGTNILNIDENKILNYVRNLNFSLTITSKQNECFKSSTADTVNILDDLIDLKTEIYKNINIYLNEKLEYGINFKITNSWVTKTEKNGFSQRHKHAHNLISGVYYPKGNKNFKIKFSKDSSFWRIPVKKMNNLNMDELTITIEKNNALILFPSDVYHEVDINTSEEDRYSIAFNVNPVGTIEACDSTVTFY